MGAAAACIQGLAPWRRQTRLTGSAFAVDLHSCNPALMNGGRFPRCSFVDRLRGLLLLRADDVRAQSVRVVVCAVREDGVEDADSVYNPSQSRLACP